LAERWRTGDPREIFGKQGHIIILCVVDSRMQLVEGLVFEEGWYVDNSAKFVSADDAWPDGWRWVPWPEEPVKESM